MIHGHSGLILLLNQGKAAPGGECPNLYGGLAMSKQAPGASDTQPTTAGQGLSSLAIMCIMCTCWMLMSGSRKGLLT